MILHLWIWKLRFLFCAQVNACYSMCACEWFSVIKIFFMAVNEVKKKSDLVMFCFVNQSRTQSYLVSKWLLSINHYLTEMFPTMKYLIFFHSSQTNRQDFCLIWTNSCFFVSTIHCASRWRTSDIEIFQTELRKVKNISKPKYFAGNLIQILFKNF